MGHICLSTMGSKLWPIFSHMHGIVSLDLTIKIMFRISTYCSSLVIQIRQVLEERGTNKIVKNPSCVTLDVDQGWITKLEVQGITSQPTWNLVDYVYIPITCKYYLRSFYKVVDCQVAKQKNGDWHWYGQIKIKDKCEQPIKNPNKELIEVMD